MAKHKGPFAPRLQGTVLPVLRAFEHDGKTFASGQTLSPGALPEEVVQHLLGRRALGGAAAEVVIQVMETEEEDPHG